MGVKFLNKNPVGILALVGSLCLTPLTVHATVGWEAADLIFDFGVYLEPGESQVLVDKAEVGQAFDVKVMWRLNPQGCRLETFRDRDGDGMPEVQALVDDHAFKGDPAHSEVSQIESLVLVAQNGRGCRIDPERDEFLVVSSGGTNRIASNAEKPPAPMGAVVAILRATSFYTPKVVTIKAGERVVWIYADGAKEPHTVTSGGCRGIDCSGGGRKFDSGPTLHKPGHIFEYTFKYPGRFEYHCELHTANMEGTVIVKP